VKRSIKTVLGRIRQAGLVLLGYRPAEVRFDAADASIAEEIAEKAANRVYSYLVWDEDLGRDDYRLYAAASVAAFLAVRRYASFETVANSPEEQARRSQEEAERMRVYLERHRRPRLYRPGRREVGDDTSA
jgi:hypothetical protein